LILTEATRKPGYRRDLLGHSAFHFTDQIPKSILKAVCSRG
jgi:hypothetical protein